MTGVLKYIEEDENAQCNQLLKYKWKKNKLVTYI